MDVDDVAGWIDLKRGPSLMAGPHPHALIPGPPVPTEAQEQAIERIAEHVIAHGIDAPGPYRAALDLLVRKRRTPGAPEFAESYLAIQGPPGSGKTYKGAELIVGLVRDGKRVGITANSHAVIGNLLDAVGDALPRRVSRCARCRRPTITSAVRTASSSTRATSRGVEAAVAERSST